MLTMTYKFLRLMSSPRWMDDRIDTSKEALGWYREEDAGDLRRHAVNELAENMTALNAIEVKFWKSEKFGKSEKSNQNIVMNEK